MRRLVVAATAAAVVWPTSAVAVEPTSAVAVEPGAASASESASAAGVAAVPARAAVTRKVSVASVVSSVRGRAFSVSGKVTRTPKGKRVVLQRRVGTKWVKIATGRTTAQGRYAFRTASGQVGTVAYRVVAPAVVHARKKLAAAQSRSVQVRIVAPPAQWVRTSMAAYPVYDGSAVPNFTRAYDSDTGPDDYKMMAEMDPNAQAWVSYRLGGKCRAETIDFEMRSHDDEQVVTFVVKLDGVVTATHRLGDEGRRTVVLPSLAGVQVMEVSATTASGSSSWGASGHFWGEFSCLK